MHHLYLSVKKVVRTKSQLLTSRYSVSESRNKVWPAVSCDPARMPRPAAGVKPAREPATFRHGFHCTTIRVLVIANHDIRPLLLEPARLIKARPARAVTLASHRPISKSWRGQVRQNTEPLRRPRGCSMTASARHPLARGRGGGDGGDRRRRCTLLGLCCYIFLSQALAPPTPSASPPVPAPKVLPLSSPARS